MKVLVALMVAFRNVIREQKSSIIFWDYGELTSVVHTVVYHEGQHLDFDM